MRFRKFGALFMAACLIPSISVMAETDKQRENSNLAFSGSASGSMLIGEKASGTDMMKAKEYVPEDNETSYELIWADEFDVDGAPDPQKWYNNVGGTGWGNNEQQFYTDGENVKVENGMLVLEARKEARDGLRYTSARLVSHNGGDFLYGRFEIRAKLPMGLGTWPAFWMLPTVSVYGRWPGSGEIDIMEHVGYDPGVIHATVHTQAYNHLTGTQKSALQYVPDISKEFHTYTLTWQPDRISIAVDDIVYFNYDPYQYVTQPTSQEWPFDKPFHLLLNIAVGGDWGGAQGIDNNAFSQQMLVDYVRVYKNK